MFCCVNELQILSIKHSRLEVKILHIPGENLIVMHIWSNICFISFQTFTYPFELTGAGSVLYAGIGKLPQLFALCP